MMVIGLTGGIASGKNTVAVILKKANIPVIDADELAKLITKSGSNALKEIVEIFGHKMLSEKNLKLDRKKLAEIVFNDQKKLKQLENILHPKIEQLRQFYTEKLKQKGHKIVVYMAPLLFETGLYKNMDKTLLITANQTTREDRIQKRDKISLKNARARINAQMDEEKKIKMADEVIENNGTLDELYKNLVFAWKNLTGMILSIPSNTKISHS
jgi:dephospho-CoA kinase